MSKPIETRNIADRIHDAERIEFKADRLSCSQKQLKLKRAKGTPKQFGLNVLSKVPEFYSIEKAIELLVNYNKEWNEV